MPGSPPWLTSSLDPLERKRPLNFLEACQHARELWGAAGCCEVRREAAGPDRFVVGTKGAMPGQRWYGTGGSFEQAFEMVQKRGPT